MCPPPLSIYIHPGRPYKVNRVRTFHTYVTGINSRIPNYLTRFLCPVETRSTSGSAQLTLRLLIFALASTANYRRILCHLGEEHDGPLQTYLKQGDSHKAAAVSFDDVGVDLFVAFLEQQWIRRGTGAAAVADIKSSTDIPTITDADTTTYSSIQPTTVDIKSLPGNQPSGRLQRPNILIHGLIVKIYLPLPFMFPHLHVDTFPAPVKHLFYFVTKTIHWLRQCPIWNSSTSFIIKSALQIKLILR